MSFFSLEIQNATVEAMTKPFKEKNCHRHTHAHTNDNMEKTPLQRIACTALDIDYCKRTWMPYSHSFHFNPPIAKPVWVYSPVTWIHSPQFYPIFSILICVWHMQWHCCCCCFFPRFSCSSARAQNQHVKYIKTRTYTQMLERTWTNTNNKQS